MARFYSCVVKLTPYILGFLLYFMDDGTLTQYLGLVSVKRFVVCVDIFQI